MGEVDSLSIRLPMEGEKRKFLNLDLLQVLKLVVFANAAIFIVIYLWIVFNRIQYPFELEWIEGGMVDQVLRIVNGQRVYGPPNIDFTPFLYTPLYFYTSAAVTELFGGGFFPLRLVSCTASLLSFTLIYMIVKNETKNGWAAFISTGLFAATFRISGAWMDIGRVDSLFISLWLLFIFFIRTQKSFAHAILAGCIATLAFMTKQTALFLCFPVMVFLLFSDHKYGLTILLTFLILIGISTFLFNWASDGWYSFYIFSLLQSQHWIPFAFITFWKEDLLIHFPIVTVLALIFFMAIYKNKQENYYLWLSVLLGALVGTFVTRVKVGGYDNVLLPLCAIFSIMFGLGIAKLLKKIAQLPSGSSQRMQVIILTACIIQFSILYYNPFAQVPSAQDRQAGDEFVRLISQVNGEVYIADHGYIPQFAQKTSYAHHSVIWDIARGNENNDSNVIITDQINNLLKQQYFEMIVFDSQENNCCPYLENYYYLSGEVQYSNDGFYPVTGWRIRPTYIYLPKNLN